MAKLADARDLKSLGRKAMRVRFPPCPEFMRIAIQGIKFIVLSLLVAALGIWTAVRFSQARVLGEVIGSIGIMKALFCLYFFRDPNRPTPKDDSKIYSPGDGTVLSVSRESSEETTTIRIFLSLLNVHVQRVPATGRVKKIEYRKGSFKAAMLASALGNEKCSMTLECGQPQRQITIDQIAGLLARRITWWAKEGDLLKTGERYGLISFGSQVAVHLPSTARATVKPGDKVFASLTPIAEWIN